MALSVHGHAWLVLCDETCCRDGVCGCGACCLMLPAMGGLGGDGGSGERGGVLCSAGVICPSTLCQTGERHLGANKVLGKGWQHCF